MGASNFFSAEQRTQITTAIKQAELNTSGEIRVHVENNCKIDVLDRASEIFSKLQMHKTEQRNGVLFYIAILDHKFAILGDAGINAKVPEGFWNEINDTVLALFKESNYTDGLSKGIIMAGEQLKKHFPFQADDVNELSDEISFGK
jgi:uncharacterized membrane protein